MHDPKTVAFEIRRPWPQLQRHAKPGRPRWEIRYQWAKWYDLRPGSFMTFWTIAGHVLYWPALITVWHNEPGGRDSGEVCRRRRWPWHVHHWTIQVHPLQRLRRRLLTRCERCGRKGSPNFSHQWHNERAPWWKGERGLYHRECSSLVHAERQRAEDETLIRYLTHALRVAHDLSTVEMVARLTDPKRGRGLEFAQAYRLTRLMGFERDDDYNLVEQEATR